MDKDELDVNNARIQEQIVSSRNKEVTFGEDEVLRSFGSTRRVITKEALSIGTELSWMRPWFFELNDEKRFMTKPFFAFHYLIRVINLNNR
ncbi:9739_t:CDS:2, partial [Acaulospora morrowiae]